MCTGFLHDMIHFQKVEESFLTKETRLDPRPTCTGLKFKVLTAQPPCKPPHKMGWGGGGEVKGEDMQKEMHTYIHTYFYLYKTPNKKYVLMYICMYASLLGNNILQWKLDKMGLYK